MRVTQYLVEQSGDTGEVQPRRERSRTGEGGGGGGRAPVGVPGEKEVERQLRVPCDEPQFEEPRVEK